MTRETKIGLVVAGSFLTLVAIVVAAKWRGGGNAPTNDPEEQSVKVAAVGDAKKNDKPVEAKKDPTPKKDGEPNGLPPLVIKPQVEEKKKSDAIDLNDYVFNGPKDGAIKPPAGFVQPAEAPSDFKIVPPKPLAKDGDDKKDPPFKFPPIENKGNDVELPIFPKKDEKSADLPIFPKKDEKPADIPLFPKKEEKSSDIPIFPKKEEKAIDPPIVIVPKEEKKELKVPPLTSKEQPPPILPKDLDIPTFPKKEEKISPPAVFGQEEKKVPKIPAHPDNMPSLPTINVGEKKTPAIVNQHDPVFVDALPGETSFTQLSKRLYGNEKYADALLAYNRSHREFIKNGNVFADPAPKLTPGQQVLHPPASILDRDYRALVRNPLPDNGPGVKLVPPAPINNNIAAISNPPLTAGSRYVVKTQGGERIRDIAQRFLGNPDRWPEIYRLNPSVQPQFPVPTGTELKMPGS